MADLVSFRPGVWLAEGPTVSTLGFRYPTRMAVLRLDEGLALWSPVAMSEGLRSEIDALGPVRHLIAPNDLHHLWLDEARGLWPDAQVHAVAPLARKRPDLAFTALGAPVVAWAGALDHVVVPGNRIATEAVFLHRPSGTVLFTDLLQQFPPGYHRGWRAVVARLDLMVGAAPQVPRKFRLAFGDRRAARAALAQVLDWPVEAIVMAHGDPVTSEAHAALARAFDWLMR